MQNIILKMPLFYTPASHFSGNGHGTMGKISGQKMATTNSLRNFCGSFSARSLPDITNKHNIKETASKGKIWGPFYLSKGDILGGG